MSSAKGNGYLRQGEFRRWAGGVDHKLGELASEVKKHGELLAVVDDRQKTGDIGRSDRRHTVAAIATAIISTLSLFALELWHIYRGFPVQ